MKCPLRKTSKLESVGEITVTKESGKFLDCIEKECAWYIEENLCCAVLQLSGIIDR